MDRTALTSIWAPRMLSILRIMTALLFLEHGTQKLLGFPPSSNPGPALFSLLGIQGIIEAAGGVLLVLASSPVRSRSSSRATWRWPTSCPMRPGTSSRS